MTLKGNVKNKYTQKEPKRESTLAKDAANAKRVGLSYGVYMGYKESGYLAEYLLNRITKDDEPSNVIESNIIGGHR